MGCGCLGPKKQKEEVYVLLITEIHLEAKRVTCNEYGCPQVGTWTSTRPSRKGSPRRASCVNSPITSPPTEIASPRP